MYMKCELVHT